MNSFTRPGKLAPCREQGPGTELFLVEGDSASSSVDAVRNAAFQAVLPMQGKPMNPVRATARRISESPLYAALVETLGAGVGRDFELARVRYGRVLLLMDPDADGIHCGLLLQMFFHRWMRPLVDSGRLLAVWAPQAEVWVEGRPEPVLAFTEPHLHSVRARLASEGARILDTVHYRGLGSMDPKRLAKACVHPDTRTAIRILATDVERALGVLGDPGRPPDPQLELF